jgi:hypothetical protein
MEALLIAENFLSDRNPVLACLEKYFVGTGATGKALDVKPQKYVNSMTVYLLKSLNWSSSSSNIWQAIVNINISDQDIEVGEQFSILLKSAFVNANSSNVNISVNIFTITNNQAPVLLKQILWAPVSGSFKNLTNGGILYKILRSKDGSFKMINSSFT